MIYTKTARKNAKGVVFAFGRRDGMDGKPVADGGYMIFKLCENYNGQVHGGISKTWRYTDENLSYEDAIKKMNKKLGRNEFIPKGV